ncbi:MAG: alcohol dehydrogenase catalytic domain-containing protein [Gammaproteobacteria bacterium]|jgi:NADPH:quinone reductase-like Zn-dependent oxidoreductase|nr:alcohol dehydrogenase catalytic domain-containing protein [Gammaproteobacteria bacterium]MDP6731660.1 alcohol dehydrogenase catalytic domain-containing protein [Gammaproteobacteria bacterium]|tara:strand:+ start:3210 stop:3587 length:378 start_codon:yes stop_codon:yes gene_type:complete
MKAITLKKYGSTDDLKLVEVACPVPEADEVLIRVLASAINDYELAILQGKPLFIRLFLGFFKPKVKIPGCEAAGIIETTGRDVSRFKPGDRVYGDLSESGFGSFAEFVCVREDSVAFMPSNLSFE